ncbi:PEP-CTERM sorting domain-containing protein [Thalassotalea sediminis]|uniref:PEP-CTERM sorting domain-containing protein n=1 Tax=Thalassotalea sediminis TaxID=1759089 RepID=UPI00257340C4|nr:PEP-CTERM sorting domain-containing protein [Thalassotalea sediminis]
MNFLKTISVSMFVTLLSVSTSAVAGLTTVSTFINEKNDCKDFFDNDSGIGINKTGGSGFSDCKIYSEDENEVQYDIAWVLSKFDVDSGDYEEGAKFNNQMAKVDWEFNGNGTNLSNSASGNWTFNNSNVDIYYWIAKTGKGYNLFWTVNDSAINNGTCSAFDGTNNSVSDSNLSLACISSAVAVNEGTYLTPNEKGLSHLTFFGKEEPAPAVVQVSEPGMLTLFGLGIAGLLLGRRKTK